MDRRPLGGDDRELEFARLRARCDGGAPHRGEFVGAEYRRGWRPGEHVDQRRNLDQSAAADHCIDHPGTECECAE